MKAENNLGATFIHLILYHLLLVFEYCFFYREEATGVTGSLAIGVAYFGVIESTKKWIEETHVNLRGP